jgi:hypothetical protein
MSGAVMLRYQKQTAGLKQAGRANSCRRCAERQERT